MFCKATILVINLWSVLLQIPAFAQSAPDRASVRSAGLGFSGSTLAGTDGLPYNPACISLAQKPEWTAATIMHYGIQDLGEILLATVHPLATGAIGGRLYRYGTGKLSTTLFAASYGRVLNEELFLGAEAGLSLFRIEGYGSSLSFALRLGMLYQLVREVWIGFEVRNPYPSNGRTNPAGVPGARLGFRYNAGPRCSLFVEVDKTRQRPVEASFGLEYRPTNSLAVRFGHNAGPGTVHFGFSVNLPLNLVIDTAIIYHFSLGLTPGIGLTYSQRE